MKWFGNQKTQIKLTIVFAVLSILMVIVGAVGYSNMTAMNTSVKSFIGNTIAPTCWALMIQGNVANSDRYLRQHIMESDATAMSETAKKLETEKAAVDTNLGKIKTAKLESEGQAQLQNFEQSWQKYSKLSQEVFALSASGKKAEATALLLSKDSSEVVVSATNASYLLVKSMDTYFKYISSDLDNTANSATMLIIGVIVFGLIVSAGLSYFISGMIANPLVRMAVVAKEIAKGDVDQTIQIDTKDENGQLANAFREMIGYIQQIASVADHIAQGDLAIDVAPKSSKDKLGIAFEQMIANLRNLVGQVTVNAENLAASSVQLTTASQQAGSATHQIAETIQQVARGAGEQTCAVTESATVVNQMNNAIEQVAMNAQAVAAASTQATTSAKVGAETVGRSVEAMQRIRLVIEPAAEKVKELGDRSAEIGNIIEVIDDIAEQTNLLALNAAIEAARAGEHGKGFAVVADEVRKLAERSSTATKEIANLIGMVQKGTEQAVAAMGDGTREVESGSKLAVAAGESLKEIIKASNEVNDQVQSISAAAQQMSASSVAVVRSTDNISSISEENAAAAEEVSAATEEMSAQVEDMVSSAEGLARMAEELQGLVGAFKLGSTEEQMMYKRRQSDWGAKDGNKATSVVSSKSPAFPRLVS